MMVSHFAEDEVLFPEFYINRVELVFEVSQDIEESELGLVELKNFGRNEIVFS